MFNTTNFSGNFSVQRDQAGSLFTAAETVIGAILLVILIVLAFLGNLLTCAVFCRKSHQRSPTNVSISVLAVSDILSAILVMPFSLASFIHDRWIFGQTTCVFNAYLVIGLLGVTLISMACTAVIRYVRVVKPSFHQYLKPKRTLIFILTLWLGFLLLIFLPAFKLFPEGHYHPYRSFCLLRYRKKQILQLARTIGLIVVTFGVLFGLMMITAYYKVFRFVSNHNQMVAPNLQQGISANVEEAKITKTLAIVVVGFVLCWIPIGIIEGMNVITLEIDRPSFTGLEVFKFLQTIFIFTSSVMNPLIYYFTNRRFRREYVAFLRKFLPSNGQAQPT